MPFMQGAETLMRPERAKPEIPKERPLPRQVPEIPNPIKQPGTAPRPTEVPIAPVPPIEVPRAPVPA